MSFTNFASVIHACEHASGAGSKAIILKALGQSDKDARILITAALNPYFVLGVKQFEMPETAPGISDDQQDLKPFLVLLDSLASRELTGDAARSAVRSTLSKFNEGTQKMLARVIDKDLRGGFSADTANKAWKTEPLLGCGQKLIPTFEVMLADKCDSTEEFEERVSFPCQADWKYDGQRTIAFVRADSVEYRSRRGLIMDHLAGVFDEDLLNIRYNLGYDFVMDGESFASDFTETINAKKAGNDKAKAALKLRAFFLMPLTDWMAQKTSITMRQNREQLQYLIGHAGCKRIVLSGGREVKDFQDMTAYCAEVTTPGFDGHPKGHEGLILKDWESPYVWDRSITWCKVKNFYDVDCKIVGFYKGKKGKRLENTLGGIKIWGRTEDGTIVESDCGSGFSDALRNEIWNNQDSWLGATVVIKYQEVSKSKNKAVASLRFPTFEHRRDDKIVE
jgi:DNA ligase-1